MRFLSYLAAFAITALLASCGGGGGSPGTVVGSQALATNAPSGLIVLVGTARSFDILGGKAPFSAISNNELVAVTGVEGSTLTIGTVGIGTATIVVRDAFGSTVNVPLTSAVAHPFVTSAPSNLTLQVGTSQAFVASGGAPGYSATSANPSVVTATMFGSVFNLTGISPGTTTVNVSDGIGTSLTLNVTVQSAGNVSLFTTAPSGGVTVPLSQAVSFSVGGGVPFTGSVPYLISSSNNGVATATLVGNTLTINGGSSGTASIVVRDSANSTITIPVTVAPVTALFTTAPPRVSLAIGTSQTFQISGGSGSYLLSSDNPSVASVPATSSGNLVITAAAPGSANIQITDTANTKVLTVAVTVSSGVTSLTTTAPSAISIAVSTQQTYSITGGSGAYVITNTNPFNVQATITGSGPTGGVLTLSGLLVGSSTVTVRDSVGNQVVLGVTVIPPGNVVSLLPEALTVSESPTPFEVDLQVFGGTGPYRAFTSDLSITNVSISGTQLKVIVTNGTTACVTGDKTVTLTVIDSAGATATSALTVKDTGAPPCP
jgi:hypothetical protein